MTLPLTILVIDGCPATRSVIATLVRTAGHSVVVAENGGSALERLDRQRADLILVDAQLPDIDAVDLLGRLREHPRTAGAFLFTISADAADTRARVSGLDTDGWLARPLCRDSLMRLVEAVAWSRSATAAMAGADRPARATPELIGNPTYSPIHK